MLSRAIARSLCQELWARACDTVAGFGGGYLASEWITRPPRPDPSSRHRRGRGASRSHTHFTGEQLSTNGHRGATVRRTRLGAPDAGEADEAPLPGNGFVGPGPPIDQSS